MGDLYLKPQRGAGKELRGLSPNMFAQAPLAELAVGGISEGFGILDDFLSFNDESPWIKTQATAGTATLADAKGGVLELDSASSTVNQGIQIQYGGATGAAAFVPNANAKIYFEARIKLDDIGSTTVQSFIGLSEIDTSIIASGANSSANHIGFEMINSTAIDLKSEKAGSRSASGSAGTLVDGTYVKVGFIVDGVSKITPYVN